jgi:hypothetical protein
VLLRDIAKARNSNTIYRSTQQQTADTMPYIRLGTYRWWLSEEACMFSGLSEDGTITVPVNRFASPWVFWFALWQGRGVERTEQRRSVT